MRKREEKIDNRQTMRLIDNNIKATGMFNDARKEWRLISTATSTYDGLKFHFTNNDEDHTKNDTTASSAGYTNQVQEIV